MSTPAYTFGHMLGQGFKDITGYGAYTVRSNSLTGVPSVGNPTHVPEGALVISHREYVGDVVTSATANTFKINNWGLNVGSSQTWEFLAQIACNYEEFKLQGVLFVFKSTSCDALSSVNTALGSVIMATNYNPYAAAFTSKAEMEGYQYCTAGLPSSDLIHPIECDPFEGAISTFYVQAGQSYAAPSDLRFSQPGTFYLATTGFQGTNVNIGELWVTYQVMLLKPKLYASLGYYNDSFAFRNSTGFTNLLPLGDMTTGVLCRGNTFPMDYAAGLSTYLQQTQIGSGTGSGLSITTASGAVTIEFPTYAFPAAYRVHMFIPGTGTANMVVSFFGPTNLVPTAVGFYDYTITSPGITGDVFVPGVPMNTNTPQTMKISIPSFVAVIGYCGLTIQMTSSNINL